MRIVKTLPCAEASEVEEHRKYQGCLWKWKRILAEHMTSMRQVFKAVLVDSYFLILISTPGELRMWLQPQVRDPVSVRSQLTVINVLLVVYLCGGTALAEK